MTFYEWLKTCPVHYEIDALQGFDGVSVAFYPPPDDDEDDDDYLDSDAHLEQVK